MQPRHRCALGLILLPALLAVDIPSIPPASMATAAAIGRCMERNAPPRASIPALAIQSVDRSGEASDLLARVHWTSQAGETRIVLRMAEPEEVRGTAVLLVEAGAEASELFVYLPDLPKVRRVRKRHRDRPLLGTDFSFEDVERIRGIAGHADVQSVSEDRIEDRPVWRMEMRPERPEDSSYQSFVLYVDQEYCLPLRTEFIEEGQVRKVLTTSADQVMRAGEHFLPGELRMRDLRDHTETRIAVREIHVDDAPPADVFTLGALERELR